MENKELTNNTKTQLPTAPTVAPKRGLEEGVEREDLILPRASLLQSKSPEVEDEVFQDLKLKAGMMINSLTKEILPDIFIPIVRFVNWIRFNPRNKSDSNFDPSFEPGALMWMTNDPHDPRVEREGKFGPNGEKPLATKFINFICYFPGVDMPVILSFSKTSFRAGKDLTSLVKFTPGGDIFNRKYRIDKKQEKNDQGTFYVFVVRQLGKDECKPSPEEFQTAENWYHELYKRVDDVKVHDQEKETETDIETVET